MSPLPVPVSPWSSTVWSGRIAQGIKGRKVLELGAQGREGRACPDQAVGGTAWGLWACHRTLSCFLAAGDAWLAPGLAPGATLVAPLCGFDHRVCHCGGAPHDGRVHARRLPEVLGPPPAGAGRANAMIQAPYGLDHRVGHFVSMRPRKSVTRHWKVETRGYLAILSHHTHRRGIEKGGSYGNRHPKKAT